MSEYLRCKLHRLNQSGVVAVAEILQQFNDGSRKEEEFYPGLPDVMLDAY